MDRETCLSVYKERQNEENDNDGFYSRGKSIWIFFPVQKWKIWSLNDFLCNQTLEFLNDALMDWICLVYPAIPQSELLGGKTLKLFRMEGNMLEAGTAGNMAQAAVSEGNVLEWAKTDKRRMLHVVYRVGNLDKTMKYDYLE